MFFGALVEKLMTTELEKIEVSVRKLQACDLSRSSKRDSEESSNKFEREIF